MTDTPVEVSRRTTPNSTWISASVRMALGSSRISTFALPARALAMETCCCSAIDREPTTAVAYRPGSPISSRSSTTRSFWARQSMRPPVLISRPVKMFSLTVSSLNSCGSWYTVAMPRSIAARVEVMAAGAPSKRMSPVSADSAPAMILMRVDLPAPFSPTRACTEPALTVMSACRMARTAPKRLEMPVRCSRASPVSGMITASAASIVLSVMRSRIPGRRAVGTAGRVGAHRGRAPTRPWRVSRRTGPRCRR